MESSATPEQVALTGYTAGARARVVASVVNEEVGRAVVLIETDPSHPYEVDLEFDAGRWRQRRSGNGWTWARLDDDADTGYQTIWDEVPPGVLAVRVEIAGRLSEAAVRDGMFLCVDWNVSDEESESWPRVVGHLTDTGWQRVSDDETDDLERRLDALLRRVQRRGWRRLLPPWGKVTVISLIEDEDDHHT